MSFLPSLPLFLSSFLLIAGCGGLRLNLGGGEANTGVHTVLLVRPGCDTFVVRTLRGGFAVVEAAEGDYVPTAGDVLAGPSRPGRSIFELYPPGAETAGSPTAPPAANVPLDLQALGLGLPDARARLDAACGAAP